jgi:uncharacterized protein YjeT (DUF2065 family)
VVRAVGVVTVVTGAALAGFPRQIGTFTSRSAALPPESIVRILGGRYIAQGLAESLSPTRRVLKTACGVDVLHAGSMVALAAVSRQYRAPALVSMMIALTSAACTAGLARRGR